MMADDIDPLGLVDTMEYPPRRFRRTRGFGG